MAQLDVSFSVKLPNCSHFFKKGIFPTLYSQSSMYAPQKALPNGVRLKYLEVGGLPPHLQPPFT